MALIRLPKLYCFLIFVAAAVTVWYAAHTHTIITDVTLPRILQFEHSCQTPNTSNPAALRVFVPDAPTAKALVATLCASSLVSKQFGSVIGYWQTEERDILPLIGEGILDLMLMKDNFINAFGTDTTYDYDIVASYADYAANLISIREKPLITKEYLLGKRLGLLDYPTSRSGYIAPMRMLKNLDLSPQQVQLSYVKSHEELRTLLISGKVDLIASYWREEDATLLSKNYVTPLNQRISGSKWYLKMLEQNTELRCEVQAVLRHLAANTESSRYLQDIQLVNPCARIAP